MRNRRRAPRHVFRWTKVYDPYDVFEAIRAVIDEGDVELAEACLIEPYLSEWRDPEEALSSGFCSAGAQAQYFLSGGKAEGFTPVVCRHPEWTHWWVRGPDGTVWDPTWDQFEPGEVDYEQCRGKGFQGRYAEGWQQPDRGAEPFLLAVVSMLDELGLDPIRRRRRPPRPG